MSEKSPFDLMLESFRLIVREELAAHSAATGKGDLRRKDWLKAAKLPSCTGFRKVGWRSGVVRAASSAARPVGTFYSIAVTSRRIWIRTRPREGLKSLMHTADYDTFGIVMEGSELRRARIRLGLTQAELAAKIGMERNSIARMERGERPVKKHTEICLKYFALTMAKNPKRRKK
jgi:DNA-binding XRE family transcriptional regulator